MKIYILIHSEDTNDACGSDVTPFTDKKAAYDAMEKAWHSAIKRWNYDASLPVTDDHECEYSQVTDSAVIRDSGNVENWRIEEHELDVQVAVEVKGGLVQNIYANADVHPDVYDLDVSDFPDDGEEDEADRKEAELNKLVNSLGWRNVW